jgi:GR25 family glycosyltransferase involved in LPS biosynthesis
MKQFIIVLKNYPKSEKFYKEALKTSLLYNWNIERIDAVDARVVDLNNELEKRKIIISHFTRQKITEMLKPGMIGCFLSHYDLWLKCIELNEMIAIFEEDIIFLKSIPKDDFKDVLKLRQGPEAHNQRLTGKWWVGADSYLIKPCGAKKIVDWCKINGALPPDHLLGLNVVDIKHLNKNVCILNPEEHTNWPMNSLTNKFNKDLLS